MPELLAHLVGDYVLQSHVMATRKTSSWLWACIHAAFYGLPFLLLASWPAWLVIVGTHAVIDRLGIARRWCQFYGVGFPGLWWTAKDRRRFTEDAAETLYNSWQHTAPGWVPWVPGGNSQKQDSARYLTRGDDFPSPPAFLGVWLVIIVDNTLHLAINHFALAWL